MYAQLAIKGTQANPNDLLKTSCHMQQFLDPLLKLDDHDRALLLNLTSVRSATIKSQSKNIDNLWRHIYRVQARLDDYKATRVQTMLSSKIRKQYLKLKAAYVRLLGKVYLALINVYSLIMFVVESVLALDFGNEQNDINFERQFDEAWLLSSHLNKGPLKDYYLAMLARKKMKFNLTRLDELLLETDNQDGQALADKYHQENIIFKTISQANLQAVVMGEHYLPEAMLERDYCLAVMPIDVAVTDSTCVSYNQHNAQVKTQQRLQSVMKKGFMQAYSRYLSLSQVLDPIITLDNKTMLHTIYELACLKHVGAEVLVARMVASYALDNCSKPSLSAYTYGKQIFHFDKERSCKIISKVSWCYEEPELLKLLSSLEHSYVKDL